MPHKGLACIIFLSFFSFSFSCSLDFSLISDRIHLSMKNSLTITKIFKE